MDLLQALILGIVQGATEFIPVSSSGHLVLVPWLLGWEAPSLLFNVMAHWGTLFAIFVYFWRDLFGILTNVLRDLARRTPLATPESRLGWLIVLATLPGVVIGFLFKSQFEELFDQPTAVALFLLVTGTLLWASEKLSQRGARASTLEKVDARDALLIGLAQSLAITPGISRSGSTIAMGLIRGLDRPAAARFSFLMMTPIVLGAGLLELKDTLESGLPSAFTPDMALGFLTAAVTGYLCIAFLLRYLAERTLRLFALYCWLMGTLGLVVAWLR